jgi:hypothetical protein
MWQDYAIDMRQIKQHLTMIEEGEQPPVHEADNHELFIQEYNRFRKSDKYKRMNTNSQALLLAGIEEHLQALINLANPQLKADKEMADEIVSLGIPSLRNKIKSTVSSNLDGKLGDSFIDMFDTEHPKISKSGVNEDYFHVNTKMGVIRLTENQFKTISHLL